jgi:glycosyltransferase involved in cell wall biosynthesis
VSRPRTLFISHSGTNNGAVRVLIHLIEYLEENSEYEIDVLIKGPIDNEIIKQFSRTANVLFLSNLEEIRKRKYLFLYSNTICNGNLLAKLTNKTTLVFTHLHELAFAIDSTDNDSVYNTLKYTDYYIACSDGVKTNLIQSFGIKPERIVRVHGFVGCKVLKADPNIKSEDFNIGCLSNMDYRKGVDLFLFLLSTLKNSIGRRNIKWTWVGDKSGFYRELLPKKYSNVQFVDQNNNPWEVLNNIDLFFNFSREDPFPLTLLESLSRKVPVCGFRGSGGIDELHKMDFAHLCDMNSKSINHFLDEFIKIDEANSLSSPTNTEEQCREIFNFVQGKLSFLRYKRIRNWLTSFKTNKILRQLSPVIYPKDHNEKLLEYDFIQHFEINKSKDEEIKFSIVTPLYEAKLPFLQEAAQSILTQSYSNWEWIIVDDGSSVNAPINYLRELAKEDERIRVFSSDKNGGISTTTNLCIEKSTGEWIVFFDQDDLLHRCALSIINGEVQRNPDWRILYTDEDKIDENGNHFDPYFKPDWNPSLLMSQNYFCHLLVVSKIHLDQVGKLNSLTDGAQDWDFCLRSTFGFSPNIVGHVPKVLYHWRAHSGSCAQSIDEKGGIIANPARRVLSDHIGRMKINAEVVELECGHWNVKRKLPESQPSASIVFHGDLFKGKYLPELEDNLDRMVYETRCNIYLPESWEVKSDRVSFLSSAEPMVSQVKSDVVVLVNSLIEPMHPGWLEELIAHCLSEEVGFCGPRIVHPATSRVISAGMVMENGGWIKSMYEGKQLGELGDKCRAVLQQNFSFLHPDCLVIRRDLLPKNFCPEREESFFLLMKNLTEQGYRHLFVPTSNVYLHSEKGPGFYWSEPYVVQGISDSLTKDPNFNENLMVSWGVACQRKIELNH